MSWDRARELERGVTRFGAHTVSHPILARVDDLQSRAEIEGSWSRLRAELVRPLPVFCYPNGKDGDYGPRETSLLDELGFSGALGTERGYASWSRVRHDARAAYAVDRFSFPDCPRAVLRYASGAERLRQLLPF
jgi:peptidoglycan/xylan/chitin deacetylase (PgdA/CDA1 family)